MSTLTVKGMGALARRFRAMREETAKATESIVKMTAVQVCVEYGRASGPGPGLADKPLLDYQKSVAAQIKRVFPSAEQPQLIAALIRRRSDKLAYAYLRAMREGKVAQARRYMKEAGVSVEEISRAAHKAARTGTGASIPKDAPVVAVVNAARQRVYVRDEQARVGMAKAAWFQAAQGLVRRVRGTARDAGGGRRSYQRFPAVARAVARKFPGLGQATVSGSGINTSVRVESFVSHAVAAADEAAMAQGRAEANAGLQAAIRQVLIRLNRRLFG